MCAQAQHPGPCKRSVPATLASFHETTLATVFIIHSLGRQNAAKFLRFIHTGWTKSYSKARYQGRSQDSPKGEGATKYFS